MNSLIFESQNKSTKSFSDDTFPENDDDNSNKTFYINSSDFKKGKPLYEWSQKSTNYKKIIEKKDFPLNNRDIIFVNIDQSNSTIKAEGRGSDMEFFIQKLKFLFAKSTINSLKDFKKIALQFIDRFMSKKIEVFNLIQENENVWNTQKEAFLIKSSQITKPQVSCGELKPFFNLLENSNSKGVSLLEQNNDLLMVTNMLAKEYQTSYEKSNYQQKLINFINLLKKEDEIIGKFAGKLEKEDDNMQNIRKNIVDILIYFKRELKEISQDLEIKIENRKKFFMVIKDSYDQLVNLIEKYGKKLVFLENCFKNAESQANLIFLPFNVKLKENQDLIMDSHNQLKKLEEKTSKLKKKIKNLRFFSVFFQNLKLNLREEMKLSLEQLETGIACVHSQVKLIFEFPRYENLVKGLNNSLFQQRERKIELTSSKTIDFYKKMNELQLFYCLLESQPNPLLRIGSFCDYLQSSILILNKNFIGMKNQLKVLQMDELQKIGSLRKEAEQLSLQVQSQIEKNLLGSDQKLILKKNLKSLLGKFETLAKWPGITEYILENIFTLKSQLEKDLENLNCFDELSQSVSLQISFSALKPLLNSLKLSTKINLLKPFLKKLEHYCNTLSQIPTIHRTIKELLARITEILPCLRFFHSTFEEYNEKFTTFSSDYETLKEEIWGLKEQFLAKIVSLTLKKDDKAFFINCGEEFLVSLKKHYESLTPENIIYLHNESKHILLEIESRINFFYCNKENLQNMAISFNRQEKLKNTMIHYFRILDKLKLTTSTRTLSQEKLEFNETEEILQKCKENVEHLLKISSICNIILEKGFAPNSKSMKVRERFHLLKEFLKDVKEGKRDVMDNMNHVHDEQINSLFISLLDDIIKLETYIEKLLPDIDKFLYFKEFFGEAKTTFTRDKSFLLNLRNFLNFYKDLNHNPNTHKVQLFHEVSSINSLIQETYTLWYEGMMQFFYKFDRKWLEKLYICLNILNKNPLDQLILETNRFVKDFTEKKLIVELKNSELNGVNLNSLGLFVKERVSYFNEKYHNLQLSVFSLENLNKMDNVNNIFFADLELIKEEFKATPSFYLWSKSFEIVCKVLEAGERVLQNPEKKTYIIWKRAIAKLYLFNLEKYSESEEIDEIQKNFLKLAIDLIYNFFFVIKNKIL